MFYFFILLITLCYFFLSLIYLLYISHSLYYKKKYSESKKIAKSPSEQCVKGCMKGICHRGIGCKDYFPYNEECCNFNFECKECTDIYDNHIYKLQDNKDVYEYPDEIRNLNKAILIKNESIRKQNDTINDINKNIQINSQYEADNINITSGSITES